jgi:hypothetical protein
VIRADRPQDEIQSEIRGHVNAILERKGKR